MNADEAAGFCDYVAATHRRHYRTALLLCQHHNDAEDLVQEAFVRLHNNWPRITRKGDVPAAYVNKIIKNLYLDKQKSFANRIQPKPSELVDHGFTTGGIEKFEEGEVVRQALGQLTRVQRLALVYHHYQEMSISEIAALIHFSERQTRRLLHAAEDAFRDALEGLDVDR